MSVRAAMTKNSNVGTAAGVNLLQMVFDYNKVKITVSATPP